MTMERLMKQKLPNRGGASRVGPLLELVLVLGSILADLWLLVDHPALQLMVRGLALTVVALSFYRRRGKPGSKPVSLRRAVFEAAFGTILLAGIVFAWASLASDSLDEPKLAMFAGTSASVLVWWLRRLTLAAIQQWVLHRFLWPVVNEVLGSRAVTTVCVAVVFGFLHLPTLPLAGATALGAAMWLILYRRSQRLLPVILSHTLLAAMASTLPGRLLNEMEVGASARLTAEGYVLLRSEDRQPLLEKLNSPRYFSYRGGTEAGYVAGLYRDVLGRLATTEEVSYGVEQLQTISRLDLAERMILSEELDETTLWRRLIDVEKLPPGLLMTPGSAAENFVGWLPPEPGWRWAQARAEELAIRFWVDREPKRHYALSFSGGVVSPRTVELELNGQSIGKSVLSDLSLRHDRFVVSGEQLVATGPNTLRFFVSGSRLTREREDGVSSLGFREFRVTPLRFPAAAILHTDDEYFLDGFSVAEKRLRWTREPVARLTYPIRRIEPDVCYALSLEAGALGRQKLGVSVNGQRIVEWALEGMAPQFRDVSFDARSLRSGPNIVEFQVPGARSPQGDPRRLGIALISLRIYPLRDCP